MIGACPNRISRLNLSRRQDFKIAARQRAPLPHSIDDSQDGSGRARLRAIARQNTERLNHVAPVLLGLLKFQFPVVGYLL